MTPFLATVASNVGIEMNYTFFDFQVEDHHYESRKTYIKDPSKVFSSYISDVPTVITGTSTGLRKWEVRSWSSHTASNACSVSYYIFSLPDGWTRQYIYRLVTRRFWKYWYSLIFKLYPSFYSGNFLSNKINCYDGKKWLTCSFMLTYLWLVEST